MADTKHLKLRGYRWYFRLRVPKDLRGQIGKEWIVEALKTGDLREAQRLRAYHMAKAQEKFDRLRSNRSLTLSEIEAAAQEALTSRFHDTKPRDYWAPAEPDSDPHTAGMDHALDMVLDALRLGDHTMVKGEAEAVMEEAGAVVDRKSPEYRALCEGLLRARAEALRAALAVRTGKLYTPPPALSPGAVDPLTSTVRTPAARPARRAAAGQRTVSTAAAAFVTDRQRDPNAAWSKQTRLQNEGTYRLFSEFVKDSPIEAVDRADVADFLDALSKLHRDYKSRKELRGASIWRLLDKAKGSPSLSNVTLNRHKSALSVFLRWCIRRGWHPGPNPAADQSRPKPKALTRNYLPFTVEELNAMFSGPPFQKSYTERTRPNKHTMDTTLAWVPLIALFTGMRSGEICQLRVEDVREEDGVAYFSVAAEGADQSIKSEAGHRRVPIHSTLIAAGLLDYVKTRRGQGGEQLFPRLLPGGREAKLNAYFGKRFRDYRKSLGILRDRTAFHSFRANAATALEAAKVPQHEAAQVIGHERKGMTYGRYSAGLDINDLKSVVEKIAYPGLDLSHLDLRAES